VKRITNAVIEAFLSHSWPGKVRELENCIERAVLLAKGPSIEMMHLPPSLQIKGPDEQARDAGKLGAVIGAQERSMIIEALKESRGNQSLAARLLGTTKRIVQYKIRKLGIDPAKFKTGKKTGGAAPRVSFRQRKSKEPGPCGRGSFACGSSWGGRPVKIFLTRCRRPAWPWPPW
jgi:Nif-specific regulatory protein